MRSLGVLCTLLILVAAIGGVAGRQACAQVPIPPPEPCPDPCPPNSRDPVKSACPDELEFYMRPPRCPWYVVGGWDGNPPG